MTCVIEVFKFPVTETLAGPSILLSGYNILQFMNPYIFADDYERMFSQNKTLNFEQI